MPNPGDHGDDVELGSVHCRELRGPPEQGHFMLGVADVQGTEYLGAHDAASCVLLARCRRR